MPSVITYDKDAALRQGIQGAGSALGNALQYRAQLSQQEEQKRKDKYEKEQEYKKYGTILQDTIGSLGEDASSMDMVRAYTDAINRGLPPEIATNMSTLQKTLREPANKPGLGIEQKDELVSLLTRFGMPDDQADREAELYLALPTGGKTQYANMFFDRMQRGNLGNTSNQPAGAPFNQLGGEIVDETQTNVMRGPGGQEVVEQEQEIYKFPNIKDEVFQERTPKERAKFKGELLKENSAKYNEAFDGVQAAEDEMFRFRQMDELNQTDKLPEGAQAFANVNWATGEIRFPRLSTPEAQAYVKLVNDFTTKAKDSYGARVTNFELQRFLKRLPTLANSKDGRQLILDQLQMATEINKLESEAITKVYDHYGTQNVTQDIALREARKMIKPQVDAIREKAIKNLSAQEGLEARKRTNNGFVPVKKKDGSIGQIPVDRIEDAQKRGWKIL